MKKGIRFFIIGIIILVMAYFKVTEKDDLEYQALSFREVFSEYIDSIESIYLMDFSLTDRDITGELSSKQIEQFIEWISQLYLIPVNEIGKNYDYDYRVALLCKEDISVYVNKSAVIMVRQGNDERYYEVKEKEFLQILLDFWEQK